MHRLNNPNAPHAPRSGDCIGLSNYPEQIRVRLIPTHPSPVPPDPQDVIHVPVVLPRSISAAPGMINLNGRYFALS